MSDFSHSQLSSTAGSQTGDAPVADLGQALGAVAWIPPLGPGFMHEQPLPSAPRRGTNTLYLPPTATSSVPACVHASCWHFFLAPCFGMGKLSLQTAFYLLLGCKRFCLNWFCPSGSGRQIAHQLWLKAEAISGLETFALPCPTAQKTDWKWKIPKIKIKTTNLPSSWRNGESKGWSYFFWVMILPFFTRVGPVHTSPPAPSIPGQILTLMHTSGTTASHQ